MANKIQTRRGTKAKLPTLSAGEPAFCTDTGEFYIGTGSGNINIGGSQWYSGTAMSGTSTTTGAYSYSACPQVKVGDKYLNTTYGYVYECTTAGSGTAAKWTYKNSIKGPTGKGVSTAAVTYQAGSSATTAPTGTWSSSVPTVAAGSYLWTRTITTYTDGTTTTAYSVARQGTNGSSVTGQRGSKWFTGTAMSGTSTTTGAYTWNDSEQKYVDDMYLNTSNSCYYKCTTAGTGTNAKWTYQGCIISADEKYFGPSFTAPAPGIWQTSGEVFFNLGIYLKSISIGDYNTYIDLFDLLYAMGLFKEGVNFIWASADYSSDGHIAMTYPSGTTNSSLVGRIFYADAAPAIYGSFEAPTGYFNLDHDVLAGNKALIQITSATANTTNAKVLRTWE